MSTVTDKIYEKYRTGFKGAAYRENLAQNPYFNEDADFWFGPILKKYRENAAVVDLGCGAGEFIMYLAQRGYQNLKGIDLSKEQVDVALAQGLDVECGDVFVFLENCQTESLDVVIALDFLEHFTMEQGHHILNEIYRVLKPGGMVMLQTPNGQGLFSGQIIYGDLTHQTIYGPATLETVARLSGFGDIQIVEKLFSTVRFKRKFRMFLWKLIRMTANGVRKIECQKTQKHWSENLICYAVKPEEEKRETKNP